MIKVLVTSTSFQDTPGYHHDLLKKQNFSVDFLRGPINENNLFKIINKYDAIICGDDQYTERVLEEGKKNKLKYISKYGIGLDSIDLEAAKKLNILVSNCPGVNKTSVAEHVLALLFSFEKNIHLQFQTTSKAKWDRMIGNEVEGKVIGIVGYGDVGSELAKKSIGIGLKVIVYDKLKKFDNLISNEKILFTKKIEFLFKNSDIISLNVPLTNDTRDFIDHDVVVNKLKRCPIIINTSRGPIVNNDAIIYGINNNLIRGYLTDVLDKEPITKDESLLNLKNVIITPHIASRTFQSVERQACMAINNLIKMTKANDK